MTLPASELPERLPALSNDELADLLISSHRPANAYACLLTEVAKRGIKDVEAFMAERRLRLVQLKAEADARLAAHGRLVRSRIFLGLYFYAAATAASLWKWRIGHDLGEALVIGGAATIVTPAYIGYWRLRHLLLARLLHGRTSAV